MDKTGLECCVWFRLEGPVDCAGLDWRVFFVVVLMESCIGRDSKVVLVCTGELQYIRLEY